MVIDVDRTVIRNQSWWQRRTSLERRLMRFSGLLAFLNIALIVALGIILTGRRNSRVKREVDQSDLLCLTSTCNMTASQLLQDMDLSKDPCDDFYRFACGEFLEETDIPDEDSSIDFFYIVEDMVQEQLKTIFEEPTQPNEIKPFVLVKNLYRTCMNTSAIEKNNLTTINAILKDLGGWPVLEGNKWNEAAFDWKQATYKLRRLGFDANYLLDFDVTVDEKNTSRYLIVLDQAELGLHEAFLENKFEDERVKAYYDFMVNVSVLMGADRKSARRELKKSAQLEIGLSYYCLSYEDLRNISGLYNSMTIAELQKRFPTIPWVEYITNVLNVPTIKITEDETINLSGLNYLRGLVNFLEKTPKRVIANYIIWRVVESSIPYLTEELRNNEFRLDQIIDGTKEIKPRWKECLIQISERMNLAVSAMYVRKHADNDVKSNVLGIVTNIKNEFIKLLQQVDWMDEETRKHALEKADTITTHIAYPDELMDDRKLEEYYSELEMTSQNYLQSTLTVDLFEIDYFYSLLRKPFNKTHWVTHSFPTEIDAYYEFRENSIRFPTGLFQGVFFDKNRPQYMNYGALGFLIGHEITHGFDDEGSEYNKDGIIQNWWVNNTKDVFKERAQCVVDQYDDYTIPEINENLKGVNTQGENIADNGGVRAAYLAYKSWSEINEMEPQLPGLSYTPLQMFWISTAHSWCAKYRKEKLKEMVDTDEHSPSSFRVLGSFRNLEYFSQDFGCPAGSNMNPKQKCRVW